MNTNRWPVGAAEWEARAAEVMDRGPFEWIAGGAGEEWTLRATREAFHKWQLRPRMLTGNLERELSVEVLGTTSPAPFLLAPIGGQTLAHPDGELAVARAAVQTGIPMLVSTAASHSMEDIARVLGSHAGWFQLYWVSDKEVTESFVDRATACGYRAIVLTVDTPMVGWRDRDLRNAYVPFLKGEGIRQYTSDPVFRSRLTLTPEEDPVAAGEAVVKMFPNLSLTWKELAWLRERVRLPLLIKGLLTAEDARRARDAGADGVIVSNHGGRQLDGAIASLDALPEVRRALGDDATVLMDSGIRRGSDVIKALALGADAVLLGRPFMYGLAVAGQEGVEHVLNSLTAEIDVALSLVGAASAGGLDPSFVTR